MKKKTVKEKNDQKQIVSVSIIIVLITILLTSYSVFADNDREDSENPSNNANIEHNSQSSNSNSNSNSSSGTSTASNTNNPITVTSAISQTPTSISTSSEQDTITTPTTYPSIHLTAYPTIYKTQQEFNNSYTYTQQTQTNQDSETTIEYRTNQPETYPTTRTIQTGTTTIIFKPKKVTSTPRPSGMQNAIETPDTEENYRFTDKSKISATPTEISIIRPQYAKSQEEHDLIDNISQNISDFLVVNKIKGTVGEKIKVVFQDQTQNQTNLLTDLEKLDNQNLLLKALMGRDPKVLQSLTLNLTDTKENIVSLKILKKQLVNKWDIENLNIILKVMDQQVIQFDQRLAIEKRLPSVYDMIRTWLKR